MSCNSSITQNMGIVPGDEGMYVYVCNGQSVISQSDNNKYGLSIWCDDASGYVGINTAFSDDYYTAFLQPYQFEMVGVDTSINRLQLQSGQQTFQLRDSTDGTCKFVGWFRNALSWYSTSDCSISSNAITFRCVPASGNSQTYFRYGDPVKLQYQDGSDWYYIYYNASNRDFESQTSGGSTFRFTWLIAGTDGPLSLTPSKLYTLGQDSTGNPTCVEQTYACNTGNCVYGNDMCCGSLTSCQNLINQNAPVGTPCTNTTCPAGFLCTNGQCSHCDPTASPDQCPTGLTCVPIGDSQTQGLCWECGQNTPCSDPTKVCDLSNGTCVDCYGGSSCPTGQVCKNNTCTNCQTSADCTQGGTTKTAVCDNGTCVQCVQNSDCTYDSGYDTCDTSTNTCVQCLKNSDCPTYAPYCKNQQCLFCRDNKDCGDQVCSNGAGCVPCDTPGLTQTCNGDLPYCSNGKCVQCTDTSQCSSGYDCVENKCLLRGAPVGPAQQCFNNRMCPTGFSCVDNVCVTPEVPVVPLIPPTTGAWATWVALFGGNEAAAIAVAVLIAAVGLAIVIGVVYLIFRNV